jgi:ubiquinone/menaquinone biosynthesis C-methylase UbiE
MDEINKQKKAFLEYEADAWFERNKEYLQTYSTTKDEVVKLMHAYGLNPGSLLEIGCSAGHRLNGIKGIYPDCHVSGLEPSGKAVEFGKKNYKDIHLVNGTADNLEKFKEGSVDVVIAGFMLYVIDRNVLLKVVSEIDRILNNGGVLILVDFFSVTTLKNEYQHIKEFKAYSYKQNYDEIFTSTKLYQLLHKSTLSHTTGMPDAGNDFHNNYTITLLKKDIAAGYK